MELKPCPFCGKMPKLIETFDGRTWTIEIKFDCTPGKCHRRGVVTTTTFEELRELAKSEAIAAWNARADDGELTALRARVEQLEAAQRWIPVEEGLPKEDTVVLGLYKEYYRPQIMAFRRYGDGWIEENDGDTYYTGITNWMPLPQPPEVK